MTANFVSQKLNQVDNDVDENKFLPHEASFQRFRDSTDVLAAIAKENDRHGPALKCLTLTDETVESSRKMIK